MKKLFLITLFTVMVVSIYSQGLNINSRLIQKLSPEGYETIKVFATAEWSTDHTMVLFEINSQSDASRKLIHLLSETKDIELLKAAIAEWSYGDHVANIKIFEEWLDNAPYGIIYTMTVDWTMVFFEYERQIKASLLY